MRAVALALALLACKREPPSVKADPEAKKQKSHEIVIHKVVPRVGTKSRVEHTQRTELDMSGIPTDAGPFVIELSDVRTEEVLAVEGRVLRKLRVTYDSHITTSTMFGPPSKITSPVVSGKTYVIDATKTPLAITDATGATPVPTETEIVSRDYDIVGVEDPMFAALPEGAVHVGDEFPGMAEAFRSSLTRQTKFKAEGKISARVEKVTRDEVTFAFKGDISIEGGGMMMNAPMNGKLIVRTSDGWAVESSMEGKPSFGGDSGIKGSGTLSVSTKRTYF